MVLNRHVKRQEASGKDRIWIHINGMTEHSGLRAITVLHQCDLSQVSSDGIQSTPLNVAVSWRGDATSTDLRIDYKYNTEAMATPAPLHDIHFLVPVNGGVAKLQAMIPPAIW